ncbi:hypothetical protein AAVH_07758 [Aphelenchoides avenae]|nr:hypothetical protein AAVH_07758 [Aphelenchus avenae]
MALPAPSSFAEKKTSNSKADPSTRQSNKEQPKIVNGVLVPTKKNNKPLPSKPTNKRQSVDASKLKSTRGKFSAKFQTATGRKKAKSKSQRSKSTAKGRKASTSKSHPSKSRPSKSASPTGRTHRYATVKELNWPVFDCVILTQTLLAVLLAYCALLTGIVGISAIPWISTAVVLAMCAAPGVYGLVTGGVEKGLNAFISLQLTSAVCTFCVAVIAIFNHEDAHFYIEDRAYGALLLVMWQCGSVIAINIQPYRVLTEAELRKKVPRHLLRPTRRSSTSRSKTQPKKSISKGKPTNVKPPTHVKIVEPPRRKSETAVEIESPSPVQAQRIQRAIDYAAKHVAEHKGLSEGQSSGVKTAAEKSDEPRTLMSPSQRTQATDSETTLVSSVKRTARIPSTPYPEHGEAIAKNALLAVANATTGQSPAAVVHHADSPTSGVKTAEEPIPNGLPSTPKKDATAKPPLPFDSPTTGLQTAQEPSVATAKSGSAVNVPPNVSELDPANRRQ